MNTANRLDAITHIEKWEHNMNACRKARWRCSDKSPQERISTLGVARLVTWILV
ncbi:hypothetical protein Smp_164910 [Schistosoma mansoni]|uniref:hypothetical protein n=1 Tax=Schistosoma mansoni TaxID=6183 RepID=UPI0001A629B4|nr:hypothetical protein Smp_164910 [Schistosoma mansoni]|eukprot:XP_018647772.1 hypothetical protein Smp_164910 [Schistosoma mansoni]